MDTEDFRTIEFTVEELWILQAHIRHDSPQSFQGEFPPYSRPLNDQIAEALAYCDKYGVESRELQLSQRDLYAIDYNVPAITKNASGGAIGREILLKTFRARQPDRESWLKEWLNAHASTDNHTDTH